LGGGSCAGEEEIEKFEAERIALKV